MTLWAATRRVVLNAFVSAAVVVMVWLLGDLTASIPALASARGLAVPLALIAPIVVSSLLGYSLTRGDAVVESASVRPIAALDAALVVVTSTAVFVALVALDATGQANYGAEAARNALGFAGLLLIGRACIGPNAATALPITFVVLLAFFGADAAGEPRWWAWAVVDSGEPASWTAALGLIGAGGVLEVARPVSVRLVQLVRRVRTEVPWHRP